MLHRGMGLVTVRVVPRADRVSVELDDRGIVVRVRAAPEGGRATEQARRALAEAQGVPGSAVALQRGTHSPGVGFRGRRPRPARGRDAPSGNRGRLIAALSRRC